MRSTTRSLASRAGAVARRVAGKKASANVRAGGAKKAAVKNAPAKKAPAKKTVAKKTPAKKAPAKKAVAKKAPAKKAVAKKTPAKKAPAKKTVAKKAPVKKTAAKKAVAKKAVATKAPTTRTPAAKKTAAKKAAPVQNTPVKQTVTKKATMPKPAPAAAPAARKRRPATPGSLVVLPTEKPWTKNQLDGVKAHLLEDIKRLVPELEIADEDLHKLMVDAGDGAGNDQADVGSSTFERDHEMTIANNARDMLVQSRHALERIDDGSYGICESCGEPIGKMRLLAFPRATLCMACKQREERR